MSSEIVECSICKDKILKSEAVFFNGKYYCSHCFRNYIVERPSEGSIFYASFIASLISSVLSFFRGITVVFSYINVSSFSSTLWSKESIILLSNLFLFVGSLSLFISLVFLLSGVYLHNAKNVRGRQYGSISVKVDLVLIFLFVLFVWMLQSSEVVQNSFVLYYLIAAVPNTISDSFLLIVLPTLGSDEFSIRQ
ncbi:MAG: hypothetical protein HA495_05630 [Thaumarchaeota archaeon]|jgi:hypothetical protein|nr:hypothetical protein [Nitrososphaerota archaeon]